MAKTFTYAGSNGGTWETAGNWTVTGSGGASTYPGESVSTDLVVISTVSVPVGPEASTSVASLSVGATSGVGDFSNLTVTGAITGASNVALSILAQTGAGSTVTLSNACVFSAATIAGSVVVNNTATIDPGSTCNGNVTFNRQWLGVLPTMTAGIHFTDEAIVTSGTLTGTTITCDDSIAFVSSEGGIVIDGATVAAASSVTLYNLSGLGDGIYTSGTVFTGPGTKGAFLSDNGVTGSYTATGFEPLYKVGAAGTVTSGRAGTSLIILPPHNKVTSGETYGVDNGETGTASAGGSGGGGSLSLSL